MEANQPELDPEAKLWRYMDIPRLISLLAENALFFSRASLMEDKFEGSWARHVVEERQKRSPPLTPEYQAEISAFYEQEPIFTIMTCWHMSEYESMAMWDLYGPRRGGVAIESTVSRLSKSLEKTWLNITLGRVRYYDPMKDEMAWYGQFTQFLHKRKSYEHEAEVRGLIHLGNGPGKDEDGNTNLDYAPPDNGLAVACDLETLVSNIYVSPQAHSWLVGVVQSLLDSYGLHRTVTRSEIDAQALF